MGLKPRPKKINKATVEQELAVDLDSTGPRCVVIAKELESLEHPPTDGCLWKGHNAEYEDICMMAWNRLFSKFELPAKGEKVRVRITIEEIPDGQ